ncbi:uncharacterized protein LOC127263557 [Andrographis paniculata]|uniref:uncharacterized protein LOC127263557 n=1 Tax=Andrographis paniculata TaxID=175694 RepID=UPI0021E9859D|nr:uncharacterized protein LOC127263557 [Andrographis paniculata]
MPLNSNDEAELVSVNTQDLSGESIVIELGEEGSVDTRDPGVESVIIALSLDDEVIDKEVELGEEGSVKADDLSDEIAAIKHEVQRKLFVEKDKELLNDTYNEEGRSLREVLLLLLSLRVSRTLLSKMKKNFCSEELRNLADQFLLRAVTWNYDNIQISNLKCPIVST